MKKKSINVLGILGFSFSLFELLIIIIDLAMPSLSRTGVKLYFFACFLAIICFVLSLLSVIFIRIFEKGLKGLAITGLVISSIHIFFLLILLPTTLDEMKVLGMYKSNSNNSSIINQNDKNNSNYTIISDNPWSVTNDYNGVYTFIFNGENDYNGIIEISGSDVKIEYELFNSYFGNTYGYTGFCGLDLTNNTFNFLIKSFSSNKYNRIYECTKESNNLLCRKKYEYDIAGYSSDSELKLIKSDNSYQNLLDQMKQASSTRKSEYEAQQEAEKKRKEEERWSAYQDYSYEQLARNPESVKGNKIKVKGEVLQVTSEGLLVDITYNGYYYTDSIFVSYTQKTGEDKILEDDIITIYGVAAGEYKYYTVLGAEKTVPKITVDKIELNN